MKENIMKETCSGTTSAKSFSEQEAAEVQKGELPMEQLDAVAGGIAKSNQDKKIITVQD